MEPIPPLLLLRYPSAIRLLAASTHVDLGLERLPHQDLDGIELALIRVRVDGETHDVLVDNEYGDADTGHRALLLMVVLRALRQYEEDSSFEEWCRIHWPAPPAEHLRPYHAALGAAVQHLGPRFRHLDPPGDLAWSVNSDDAQALRRIAEGES